MYPFSAVLGQDGLKTALILTAICPALGGLLVRGGLGSAKSTLARGLAEIMPSCGGAAAPFVDLPLGASEDMLLGSLDLAGVLRRRRPVFHPGLLARADGGILYVDEVNLLPDYLVDQLLDVAASGVNIVERDGISHRHPARFMLLGTMNPDEGGLRPQLQDRFGLSACARPLDDAIMRAAVIRSRQQYDADPTAFRERHAEAQERLRQRICEAARRLVQVRISSALRTLIAERCLAAGVEGMRADLSWQRAACAHAAWRGRRRVRRADLDAVAELVLAHRRREQPPPAARPPEDWQRPADANGAADSDSAAGSDDADGTDGDWGAMPSRTQTVERPRHLPDAPPSATPSPPPRTIPTAASRVRGRQGGRRQPGAEQRRSINWFRTLVRSAGDWPPAICWQRRRCGRALLHLLLLDCSGSTLAGRGAARAREVVWGLLMRARRMRAQVRVLGFGGTSVRPLPELESAPESLLRERLDMLPGGGGTPLRRALQRAAALADAHCLGARESQVITWLVTDGRSRERVADIRLRGDAVLVDMEGAAVRRGRGAELAAELGARYLRLAGP